MPEITATPESQCENIPEQVEISEKKPRHKRAKKPALSEVITTTDSVNEPEASTDAAVIADESTPAQVTKTIENSPTDKKDNLFKSGDVFETRLSLLYSSSVAPRHFRGIRGKFYIWNDEIINGRIRLTDSPSGVGKPERIIGWMIVPNKEV